MLCLTLPRPPVEVLTHYFNMEIIVFFFFLVMRYVYLKKKGGERNFHFDVMAGIQYYGKRAFKSTCLICKIQVYPDRQYSSPEPIR